MPVRQRSEPVFYVRLKAPKSAAPPDALQAALVAQIASLQQRRDTLAAGPRSKAVADQIADLDEQIKSETAQLVILRSSRTVTVGGSSTLEAIRINLKKTQAGLDRALADTSVPNDAFHQQHIADLRAAVANLKAREWEELQKGPARSMEIPVSPAEAMAPLGPVDISEHVTQFEYEEAEKKTDQLKLTLNNQDLSWFDSPLFDTGAVLLVSWGYYGAMSAPREVVVQHVKGSLTLTVEAQCRGVLMNKEVKTRTFTNVTRAEVVRQIALEYGYGPDTQDIDDGPAVQSPSYVGGSTSLASIKQRLKIAERLLGEARADTSTDPIHLQHIADLQAQVNDLRLKQAVETAKGPPRVVPEKSAPSVVRYPTIAQAAMTDAQFLKRLADLQGFEFYIDFDGLHWHRRRFNQKPVKRYTYFLPPGVGDIISFNVDSDLTAKPGQVTVKGKDPITKTEISATANNATTPRTQLASVIEIVDPVTGQSSLRTTAASASVQPTSEPTAAAATKEAAGQYIRSQQSAVEMTLELVGDPYLVCKTIVEVSGLGKRLSGKYYIHELKHTIAPGQGYKMSAKCRTDGTNGSAQTVQNAGAGKLNDQKAPAATATAAPGADAPALTPVEVVNPITGETSISYRDTRGRDQAQDPRS